MNRFLIVPLLAALPWTIVLGQPGPAREPGEGPGGQGPPPMPVVQDRGVRIFPGGGPFTMTLRANGPIMSPWRINALDQSRFDVAGLLAQKGELDEAAAELKAIADKSPEADAVACAHLSLGNLRKATNDPEGALAEYRQAGGTFANYAARAIADIFSQKKQFLEGAVAVEELLGRATGARTIALILATLSKLYDAAGDRPKAIATLRSGRDRIPKDQIPASQFMSAASFRETLDAAALLKEQGKDTEAEDILADLETPWRRGRRRAQAPQGAEVNPPRDRAPGAAPQEEIEIKR